MSIGGGASPLSTHVLNTATGMPASDLYVRLFKINGRKFRMVKNG